MRTAYMRDIPCSEREPRDRVYQLSARLLMSPCPMALKAQSFKPRTRIPKCRNRPWSLIPTPKALIP